MHDFDFPAFLQSRGAASARRNGTVRVASPHYSSSPLEVGDILSGKLELQPLHELCRAAQAQRELPVLQLDGLIPLGDFLIDRPLQHQEFLTETRRLASKRPRWPSLLQNLELQQLAADCPGARNLIAFRKQCVGYFIAE